MKGVNSRPRVSIRAFDELSLSSAGRQINDFTNCTDTYVCVCIMYAKADRIMRRLSPSAFIIHRTTARAL